MKNRFNLNEEEKKHIRGLHNINEQEAPTDSLGNPIEPNPLLKKSEEEEILEKRLDWTRKTIKDVAYIEKQFVEWFSRMKSKLKLGAKNKLIIDQFNTRFTLLRVQVIFSNRNHHEV